MNRRNALKITAILALAALAPLPALAGKAEIYTGLVSGTGAGGYDVVSYQSGTPVEGKAEFSTSWKGAEWRFASAANRDTFSAAPEKYAPQFGGYCAWAVSQGYTAKGDPKVWLHCQGRPESLVRGGWQALSQLFAKREGNMGQRHPRKHQHRQRQLAKSA